MGPPVARSGPREKGALVRSNRTHAAGKPFKKGADSRRHKLGRMSLDRAAFATAFNNSLCAAGNPKELAEILWKRARAGHAWAVLELLERTCGKVIQAVQAGDEKSETPVLHAFWGDKDKPPALPEKGRDAC